MNPETILKIIFSISPWFIAKIFIMILLFLYICLGGIILRQVDLMNQVLEAKFSPIIRLVSLAHLIVTIFIFLLALISL